ncbi:hypothetical protein BH11ACT7_BH11ACT7_12680 [soil metagenome]
MSIDEVAPHDIRHGDVIQDPRSGHWITVTRIVTGRIGLSEKSGTERKHDAANTVTFYGDGRLDEEVTVYGDVTVSRKLTA